MPTLKILYAAGDRVRARIQIANLLRQLGHDVTSVGTWNEFLGQNRSGIYDLVIVDKLGLRLDTLDVLKLIQEQPVFRNAFLIAFGYENQKCQFNKFGAVFIERGAGVTDIGNAIKAAMQ